MNQIKKNLPAETGARIAQLRREKNLAQAQLAQTLGVTDGAVSRWETGSGMPDTAFLPALADALDTTVDVLLRGDAAAAAPAPQAEQPLASMTTLRSRQALAQLATCLMPPILRAACGLFAALPVGCAVLFAFLSAGAVSLWVAVFSAFFSATLAWNALTGALTKRTLRAQWQGDTTTACIEIYAQHCIWQRGTATTSISHSALRRIDTTKSGFVLRWHGCVAFVPTQDAAAVQALCAQTGVTVRKPARAWPLALVAGVLCAVCVALALLLGVDYLRYRARFGPQDALHTTQIQAPQNSVRIPGFAANSMLNCIIQDGTAYFTTDGGATILIPPTPHDTPVHAIEARARTGLLLAIYDGAYTGCIAYTSTDDGRTWQTQLLSRSTLPMTWSKLEFLTENLAYFAAGSHWSMGAGEEKIAHYTRDGGETWQAFPALPLQGTSNTLCGFVMAEDGAAVLALKTPETEDFPLIYVFSPDTAAWVQTELPWDEIGLSYVHSVSELTALAPRYHLVVTQLPYDTPSVGLTANSLAGPWVVENPYRP